MTQSVLAQQLRAIQQQDRLARGVLPGHTFRPSFLFDDKEAADIDDETVHMIAIEGWDELVKEDPTLRIFDEKFFSASSLSVDLSMMVANYCEEAYCIIDRQGAPRTYRGSELSFNATLTTLFEEECPQGA